MSDPKQTRFNPFTSTVTKKHSFWRLKIAAAIGILLIAGAIFMYIRSDWLLSEGSSKKPEYILPDSSSRYLTEEELRTLSKSELRLLRNEFYAKHGRKFLEKELQEYFSKLPWYKGTVEPENFNASVFNEYEAANIKIVLNFEKKMGYVE